MANMKQLKSNFKTVLISVIALTIGCLSVFPALASASGSTAKTPAAKSSPTVDQQHLLNIIAKGNDEINRRLASLEKLSGEIQSTSKLNSSDQAALEAEVNTELSGLKGLQTQLDGETQLSAAITDAQNIISEYRVYALVLPKVWLIKVADTQQTTEAKLTTVAQKLQTRLNADQTAAKDVTALVADLASLNSDISSAASISSSIEQAVLPLQPGDYDTNHSILSGDAAKLQTAHNDCVSAAAQAKTIITGLESLK